MAELRTFVCVLLVVGCGTLGAGVTPPRTDRVNEVLTKILAAEAEPMGLDTRANDLRRQARREYHDSDEALLNSDPAKANELLDRAEVDAELSVALARRESWEQQATERGATLQSLRADAVSAGGSR